MPSFIAKMALRDSHKIVAFFMYFGFFFLNFFVIFPLFLLISCCLILNPILDPPNSPPNEVTGIFPIVFPFFPEARNLFCSRPTGRYPEDVFITN